MSLVSIILLAGFAGRTIYQASIAEAEHALQALAFAAGNALELPIQELRAGRVDANFIQSMLFQMFADNPDMSFTVYQTDGTPLVDSSESLPPQANRKNAPEVLESLQSDTGRGVAFRQNSSGKRTMFMAVLVQREIEVSAILRLGLLMEPTQAAAQRSIALLLLVSVVIASGVSLFGWLLANNLARPVQVLTKAVENMEQGDLGVRVEPSGTYEMHRLAVAFNKMASRLQSNVNDLRAFVANASHELRTPLTVVKLRAESLQDGALEDPEVAGRFLEEIECEVDRLVLMVNDMLDLSRMEAGMDADQPVSLDLSTIASEVYETFEMRAEHADLTLECDIQPGLAPVLGNEDQLRRVLYNLLDNAIKYTPSGGKVILIMQPGPKENTVRIGVQDNGPGIASEHLPHIFERFYRVEKSPGSSGAVRGSGLGLAIAKSIVESHGGETGVTSQVNTGTTFWADLPAHE